MSKLSDKYLEYRTQMYWSWEVLRGQYHNNNQNLE